MASLHVDVLTQCAVQHGFLTVVSQQSHIYGTVCTILLRCFRPRLLYLIVCDNPVSDQGDGMLSDTSRHCCTQTAGSTTLATMPVCRESGSTRFISNYCIYLFVFYLVLLKKVLSMFLLVTQSCVRSKITFIGRQNFIP